MLRHSQGNAKSLLALSNLVIFSVAHVEFVKCSLEDGQSPIFVIPVEYSGGQVMIPEALVPLLVRTELSSVAALLLTS